MATLTTTPYSLYYNNNAYLMVRMDLQEKHQRNPNPAFRYLKQQSTDKIFVSILVFIPAVTLEGATPVFSGTELFCVNSCTIET
jgi:hypothetical protein